MPLGRQILRLVDVKSPRAVPDQGDALSESLRLSFVQCRGVRAVGEAKVEPRRQCHDIGAETVVIGDDRYVVIGFELAEPLRITQVTVHDDQAFKTTPKGPVGPLHGVIQPCGIRLQDLTTERRSEGGDLIALTEHDGGAWSTTEDDLGRESLRQLGHGVDVVRAQALLGEIEAFQWQHERVRTHESACYGEAPSVLLDS